MWCIEVKSIETRMEMVGCDMDGWYVFELKMNKKIELILL